MIALPGICSELRLRIDANVPLVNSRDVAEKFGKRHDHVLRDIKAIELSPDLGAAWFRPTFYIGDDGTTRPSSDMTRDGLMLLVMGWQGERAMALKVRYIEAFNAMEMALHSPATVSPDQFIQAVREIVAPLAVRFDGQDRAIERVEARVDGMAHDLAAVKARILGGRRKLTAATKCSHVDAINLMGGRCPCCSEAIVIIDGGVSKFAQFDHFYANSQPNPDHTWLICTPCHSPLSSGKVPRDQREAEFRAYQQRRRRLPGQQPTLF